MSSYIICLLRRFLTSLFVTVTLCAAIICWAEPDNGAQTALAWIDGNAEQLRTINHRIWSYAETGLEEFKSSKELADYLEANGFVIKSGGAGMQTAFVASYGNGKPVIGILAEYDALPGLSQEAVPVRKAREGVNAGHGCGHSLFGTASTGAAIAIRQAIERYRLPGTVRLYGTPAEETGMGKLYMLREGLFDDVDVVLTWHASNRTRSGFSYTKAVVNVKFTFDGLPAHASVSPHEGRSALDAVELMDVGVNFMREHVKEDARIHYVITDGGGQPNVVPPRAQVWYYIRANKHTDVEEYFRRVQNIAKGAALMTETNFKMQVDTDTHEVLPNEPLSKLIDKNLRRVGPPRFTDEEKVFARKTQEPLGRNLEAALSEVIEPRPATPGQELASTDVGDVSWKVPVGSLTVASYSYGAPGHSWQIAACSGMSIGEKGMLVAAKTLALTGLDLLTTPSLVETAKRDFHARRDPLKFVTLIPAGQRAPAKIK